MKKTISIVKIANGLGAVTSGNHPIYSFFDGKSNDEYKDWIQSMKEDLPNHEVRWGDMKDKTKIAQFLIRSQKIRG